MATLNFDEGFRSKAESVKKGKQRRWNADVTTEANVLNVLGIMQNVQNELDFKYN